MLFLMTGLLFLVTGCATVPFVRDVNTMYYLDVTSTPSDAEVYINDRLVGKTPSAQVPLTVTYTSQPAFSFGTVNYVAQKEQYVLRVHKDGYSDAIETIPLVVDGQGTFGGRESWIRPSKYKYNFVLKKNEKQ